jgi:hypothetical protein
MIPCNWHLKVERPLNYIPCHLHEKVILSRQKKKKKNYGNSNISPCKNIIFEKPLGNKPKSFKIL